MRVPMQRPVMVAVTAAAIAFLPAASRPASAGAPITGDVVDLSDYGGSPNYSLNSHLVDIAYNPDGDEYLAVFSRVEVRDGALRDVETLYARRIKDGQPLGVPITIDTVRCEVLGGVSVAYASGSGRYLVCYAMLNWLDPQTGDHWD